MNVVVDPGIFKVMIGSSSADIMSRGEFEVKDENEFAVIPKK